MSLYALIRNSYDPESDVFRLSGEEVELEGHLDGNLCRCTGYKPILEAARTFIVNDLGGRLAPELNGEKKSSTTGGEPNGIYHSEANLNGVKKSNGSCGKVGGCCRDTPGAATPPCSSSSTLVSPKNEQEVQQYSFKPYSPKTELIFPPALWKHEKTPIYYGNSTHIWIRPINLEQLLLIKESHPSAKIVGGSSEVQIEVRFKNSSFPISVYVSDIEELRTIVVPKEEGLEFLKEVSFGANASLTDVEVTCKELYSRIGERASVLEAIRKQLRFFAGRQIRNVASLAGNIVTASPISDINPVLLACGATLTSQSKREGEMTLQMSTFFTGYRKTVLPEDAVITSINIPLPEPGVREITKAYKQAKRQDDDIAIVTAAFRVRLDSEGLVSNVSLAYGGMAPTTIEIAETMKYLLGEKWQSSVTLSQTLSYISHEMDLKYDVPGGMAHYRKALAQSMFLRFWHETINEFKLGEVDLDLVNELDRGISTGTRDDHNPYEQSVIGKQIPHLSALKQATGEAEYIDDMPPQHQELYGAMVLSSRAHAKLVDVDWKPALAPGLAIGYVDHHDIPIESNLWGSVVKDEPFFAIDEVFSHGQPIGLVYAETALQAQSAARAVKTIYEDLPSIITIDEAIAAKSFFKYEKILKKGVAIEDKMDEVWDQCDRIFKGTSKMGGQEHFYLETNAALVIPNKEDKSFEVWSSTQNTMETQEYVAQITGVPAHRVNARVKRMGGAFGGKESRSLQLACLLAVAAKKEMRPMRCMLNRDEDMMTTGQRHPIQCHWKVGVKSDGTLLALEADVYDNAGFSLDLSGAVMDRCCTHLENCYEIPNVLIRGHVCKTNTHSNTAFRGFGAPQAMYITECYMTAIAEGLEIDIDSLRAKNLYKQGQVTPFLQKIDSDWHIPLLLSKIRQEASYEARKAAVVKFNREHKWKKRGISLLPTKFGLSFATALHLNQAGASVKIYTDGSVLLHHGGTEMGQGLYTKMAQICAQELNVPIESIFTQDTTTYQIPNPSPTAASSGSDLNGMAVKNACDILNERLAPFREKFGEDAQMKVLAKAAYMERVNLAADGFWKMPRIGYLWGEYDVEKAKPMYYYFTQVGLLFCLRD